MICDMSAEWDAVKETAKELLDYADQLTEYAQGLLDIAAAGCAVQSHLLDKSIIGQEDDKT